MKKIVFNQRELSNTSSLSSFTASSASSLTSNVICGTFKISDLTAAASSATGTVREVAVNGYGLNLI